MDTLQEYHDKTRLLNWYKHQRAEQIAKIQPIAIKEYHNKCNSRNFTELERTSFCLEYPEFSDYWKTYLIRDKKIILYDKSIAILELHLLALETQINDLFYSQFGD